MYLTNTKAPYFFLISLYRNNLESTDDFVRLVRIQERFGPFLYRLWVKLHFMWHKKMATSCFKH